MDVIATVNISNGDFGDWLEFFKSYETLRHKYVENEIITQISSSQAVVSFTIVDFDGEDRLGISVEIKEKTE